MAEEEDSYDEEDDESDQDLDSELGDTLDVNDMKYPNIDKDKSSGDDNNPTQPPAAGQLPRQASETSKNNQESFTDENSNESSPQLKQK